MHQRFRKLVTASGLIGVGLVVTEQRPHGETYSCDDERWLCQYEYMCQFTAQCEGGTGFCTFSCLGQYCGYRGICS